MVKYQQELEKERKLLEEAQQKLSERHTKSMQAKQQAEFSEENVKRLQEELEALADEKKEIHRNRENEEGEIQHRQEEIQRIKGSIDQAGKDAADMEALVQQLTEEKQKVSAVHKDFFRKREEVSQQMSDLDKERFRLDNKRERLQDFKERQTNYMWEEYNLTPSEAESYRSDTKTGADILKKRVGELKAEIKALGPINVNAIEEYKEVSGRYEFLSAQHSDLVKAGEALKDIIADLDSGMRKQFTQQFAIMQKEFSKAFKELFGGGQGTLELVENEDILEAGIRIIAQPPGKKLQNMMQMSGGEKALTAIALLFAIQNMKPSPFCLLDEIEAALDENNVTRYAEYLKKLTKNTQFIIITHRRGTMAAADRLYGITMQEKGVSAQVSVNMVENDLDE